MFLPARHGFPVKIRQVVRRAPGGFGQIFGLSHCGVCSSWRTGGCGFKLLRVKKPAETV